MSTILEEHLRLQSFDKDLYLREILSVNTSTNNEKLSILEKEQESLQEMWFKCNFKNFNKNDLYHLTDRIEEEVKLAYFMKEKRINRSLTLNETITLLVTTKFELKMQQHYCEETTSSSVFSREICRHLRREKILLVDFDSNETAYICPKYRKKQILICAMNKEFSK